MKKNAKKLLLTAGAVVGTSLLAAAWVNSEGQAHVWLSDSLLGSHIHSDRGQQIGKLEDLIVSPKQDSSYAVLSLGSWANMADRYYAMPWSLIRTDEADVKVKDSERKLVLTVDKELLRSAPNFERSDWPDMTNADWREEIDTFYARRSGDIADGRSGRGERDERGDRDERDERDQRRARAQEASARMKTITWRATELEGSDIVSSSDETIGEIEELAVDTDGRFCYVAVSSGGFLGIGERVVAVPWGALQFSLTGEDNDERVITLASTKAQLEKAPEFSSDEEDRTRMSDREWIATVYQHFSVEPYWETEATAKAKPAGTPRK